MRNRYLAMASAALLAGALSVAVPAKADDISTSIGTQHFTDGQIVKTGPFNTAVAGQPAPFNTFCGSSASVNCSATWTFDYTIPTGDTIKGATLTLGILGIDSKMPGNPNPVSSLTLNGTDKMTLTGLLNSAADVANAGANVYEALTINIPNADFVELSGSSATFALMLQGPGLGALGTTPFHGAGLDFSTLDITATPGSMPPPVPEPATCALLLTGMTALGLLLGRRA